jgi:hypothetical protein
MGRLVAFELDSLEPQELSILSVKAIEVALPAAVSGDGNENALAKNDGATVARSGKRRAPLNVLPGPPLCRQAGLSRMSVTGRPAVLGPITSREVVNENGQDANREGQFLVHWA